MWCHRRFTWRYTCNTSDQVTLLASQVQEVLQEALDATPQFYRDAEITGMAFGILEFGVIISDRDQWWVGRRARFLVDEFRKHTKLPLEQVSEERVKLPPHPNRGKYRLRRLQKGAQGG